MRTKTKIKIGLSLFSIVGIILLGLSLISAGFGSTYLPKVDGEDTLKIPIGSNQSYFIYPQNFDNKTLVIKINITDENKTMINTLQSTYEIPPNTESDDFKVELLMGLENKTELIGKKYQFSYVVFSTFKTNETSSVVTFNPIGYTKSFVIMGIDPLPVIIPPVNNTNTTIPTPATTTPSSSSSSSSSSSNSVVATPKKTTTPAKTINTEVKNEIPIETPVAEKIVKQINYYVWIVIGVVAVFFIAIATIIFIVIKKSNQNQDYKNYNLNEDIK